MLDTVDLVFVVCSVFIGTASVVLNSVVVVAIWRHKIIQTPNTVLIANLALANLTEGVVLPILTTINVMNLQIKFIHCAWLNLLLLVCRDLSLTMVLIIACERFVAVRYPFYHFEFVDVKRAVRLAASGWFLCVALQLGGGILFLELFFTPKDYEGKCNLRVIISISFDFYFEVVFKYSISILLMTSSHIYILKVARLQEKTQRILKRRFSQQTGRESRKPSLLIIVLVVFVVSHTPEAVMSSIEFLQLKLPWDRSVTRILNVIAALIRRSSEIVNPFIYAYSNSRINIAINNIVLNTAIDKWSISSFPPTARTSIICTTPATNTLSRIQSLTSDPPIINVIPDTPPDTPSRPDIGGSHGYLSASKASINSKSSPNTSIIYSCKSHSSVPSTCSGLK